MKESTGEWNGVLLSSAMGVGSVCIASDGHTHVYGVRTGERLLPYSPTTYRPHLRLQSLGSIRYNSRLYFVFVQGKVNSARTLHRLLIPCYCNFFGRKVIFQQDSARPHTVVATQRALRRVQQLPWPARSQDLSSIEHVWDMMKRQLTFFLSLS